MKSINLFLLFFLQNNFNSKPFKEFNNKKIAITTLIIAPIIMGVIYHFSKDKNNFNNTEEKEKINDLELQEFKNVIMGLNKNTDIDVDYEVIDNEINLKKLDFICPNITYFKSNINFLNSLKNQFKIKKIDKVIIDVNKFDNGLIENKDFVNFI